jgi:putative FmdB family regulatory protein
VPIYVYQCSCGLRFERLVPRDSDAPTCPECGAETRKIPAGSSLGGRGRRGGRAPGKDSVPPQWRGVRDGGPATVQREVEFRRGLVAKQEAPPPAPPD